jgi:RimJ/RimL family protein N-acetyltransferase
VDGAPEHVIGVAGLKVAAIKMPGDAAFRALNLYYRFRPTAWGRGYAAEAVGAALGHARTLRADLPVCALIRADNEPSRRLAARLGLRESGKVDAAGRRVHLLGDASVLPEPQI